MKTAKPDVERPKLQLKDLIHILAVFGGVREATSVANPRCLLEG